MSALSRVRTAAVTVGLAVAVSGAAAAPASAQTNFWDQWFQPAPSTSPAPAPSPTPAAQPDLFKRFLRAIFFFDCKVGEIEPNHKFFCFED